MQIRADPWCNQDSSDQASQHAVVWTESGDEQTVGRWQAADCGVYALLAAAQANGLQVEATHLLNSSNLPSELGMSIGAIVREARRLGLNAIPMRNLTVSALTSSNHPVILNLNRRGATDTSGHWVTYLGVEDGELVIFDSSRRGRMAKLSPAELQSMWQGFGVVVSDEHPRAEVLYSFVVSLCPFVILFAVACLQAHLFRRQPLPRQCISASITILLLAISLVVLNPAHPSRTPHVAQWLASSYARSAKTDRVSKSEFISALKSQEVLLVDARGADSYRELHVAGSLSLPIDLYIDEFRRNTDGWSKNRPIYVYCNGPQCGWADAMARHLRNSGFRRVSVFDGGMQVLLAEELDQYFIGTNSPFLANED